MNGDRNKIPLYLYAKIILQILGKSAEYRCFTSEGFYNNDIGKALLHKGTCNALGLLNLFVHKLIFLAEQSAERGHTKAYQKHRKRE